MLRNPDVSWSDEDLVQACLAGNEAAWTALVEKYKKLVYGMTVRYQLAPEDAAEVFQGVWSDLYRDLSRLQHIGGLRSWLMTAASRRSLRCKQQRRRVHEMSTIDAATLETGEDPATVHEDAERRQKLREAIWSLSPRCRDLVRMLFFTHPPKPYEEVARDLGLAVGSIGFIRGRCLRKLRQLLEEMGIGA